MRVYYYFDPEDNSKDAIKGNFDVLEDILQNRRIKISRVSLLNDPFDVQMSFSQEVSRSDVANFRKKFSSVIDKVLGFISFSECIDNVLMWSHYARKHMGFALELDVEDKLLTRVKYSSAAPMVFQNGRTDNNPYYINAAYDILRTKALDWAYEKEWRMILLYSTDNLISEGNSKYLPLNASNIKSIFIGLRCKMESDNLLKHLQNWNLNHVKVYKMEQSQDGYTLSYGSDIGELVRRQRIEQIKRVILDALKTNDIQKVKQLLS